MSSNRFGWAFVWTYSLILVSCATTAPAALPTRVATAVIPSPPTPPLYALNVATATTMATITAVPTAPLIPSPIPCTEPGLVETAVFPSITAGDMNMRIYLPPCYREDKRAYPVLYMLPGNIHSEAFWDEIGLDETADQLIAARHIPPLIIVMPDGGPVANNTSGGYGSYETVILNELIPFIDANYCTWPQAQGRAIGGVSRGGYWSLEIAFRHPDQFASVGGHSAALLDITAGPDLNPQYTGLSNNLGPLRIYLDIGKNDYVIHNMQQLHQEMEAAGIPHTWVLNKGEHNEAYWAVHLAEYLEWYAAPWLIERERYPLCENKRAGQ